MTAQPPRPLTDAKEMRALAHPIRLAVLELLARDGPMTATAAGDALGESPANMSFHLRTLAKYGFVEEAPGGTGRQRPWRRVVGGHSFDMANADPEIEAAAHGLSQFAIDRAVERRRTWDAISPTYSPAWREAAFELHALTYLTSEELQSVSEEIMAVVSRYAGRVGDRDTRPDGAQPVTIMATGHPVAPTASGN